MERVQKLQSHLSAKRPAENDIVIVAAARTAIGKAGRGAFSGTSPIDLLSTVLSSLVKRCDGKVAARDVEDIVVGNVLLEGSGATLFRMAALNAAFPDTTAVRSVNRQCSSGLEAIASAAASINAGFTKVAIAAGVESMSFRNPRDSLLGSSLTTKLVKLSATKDQASLDCVALPMGETSERVAERYNVTRADQDAFALASYQKALAAQKAKAFEAEIVPVTVTVRDKDGNPTGTKVVAQDEGPRPTTLEGLAKLKPAFRPNGTSTAGNSSQVSDGAAGVLLMTRGEAARRGLKVLGVLRSYATIGCPPEIMGVGPRYAIPLALAQAGMTVKDVDVFEVNEAFASQALYTARDLHIEPKKVNPLGGAIALGHPLGCTGARQTVTLLHNLHRTGQRSGVVSMCIGTGMGAAAVFTKE